jgi:hypothetical protein
VFIAFLLGLMVVFPIGFCPKLGLFEFSPFWRKILSFVNDFLLAPDGTRCFAAAVLIWIAVTFRRGDWVNLLGEAGSEGRQSMPGLPGATPRGTTDPLNRAHPKVS